MDRFIANHAFVSDFYTDRIERALLPDGDFIEHRVRHHADEIGRHIDALQILQMRGNLPGAHAPRIHRYNLFIEARKAALMLGYQLRVEAGLAVPRDINLQLAGLGHYVLPAIPVARVSGTFACRKMVIHLRV